VLKGFVDLEFEDGTKLHCTAGDSVFIAGGMRHNETLTSDDMEILEVSVPAKMGTVAVDRSTHLLAIGKSLRNTKLLFGAARARAEWLVV